MSREREGEEWGGERKQGQVGGGEYLGGEILRRRFMPQHKPAAWRRCHWTTGQRRRCGRTAPHARLSLAPSHALP